MAHVFNYSFLKRYCQVFAKGVHARVRGGGSELLELILQACISGGGRFLQNVIGLTCCKCSRALVRSLVLPCQDCLGCAAAASREPIWEAFGGHYDEGQEIKELFSAPIHWDEKACTM